MIKRSNSGSTFLFVAAAIALGLVALAILVPRYLRANSRSTLPNCKGNLKNIGTAMEMYSTDWSGKYPASLAQLTPNYLKTIPDCITAGEVTYRAAFGPDVGYNTPHFQDYYIIWCAGEHHVERHGLEPNFPQYDGIDGLIEGPREDKPIAILPPPPPPAPVETASPAAAESRQTPQPETLSPTPRS
jgi:hypothetical protein